jgi:hypothetical protein
VSIVTEVGLLLIGMGFEALLLGMEEGRGVEFEFESIDDTRVDGSGMMILDSSPLLITPSSLDAPAKENTSPDCFGVLIDSNIGVSKLV